MKKDIIIKECDEEFADLVYNLHNAYLKRVRMGLEIHFSGEPNDFKCYINKVDTKKFFELISPKNEKIK